MSGAELLGMSAVSLMVGFMIGWVILEVAKGSITAEGREVKEVLSSKVDKEECVKLGKMAQGLLDSVKDNPSRFICPESSKGYLYDKVEKEMYWGGYLGHVWCSSYRSFQFKDTVSEAEYNYLCKAITEFYKGRKDRMDKILRLRKARNLAKGLDNKCSTKPKKVIKEKPVVLGEKAQCLLDYVTKYPGRFSTNPLPTSTKFVLNGVPAKIENTKVTYPSKGKVLAERRTDIRYYENSVHKDFLGYITPDEWGVLVKKVKRIYRERGERLSRIKGERLLRRYCECDGGK